MGIGRSILISVKGDGGERGSTMNRHSALKDKPKLLLRARAELLQCCVTDGPLRALNAKHAFCPIKGLPKDILLSALNDPPSWLQVMAEEKRREGGKVELLSGKWSINVLRHNLGSCWSGSFGSLLLSILVSG